MAENYNLPRLRSFVVSFAKLLNIHPSEAVILEQGCALLKELIDVDDWLPDDYAQPHPQYYQQYLLHADSAERFSVVSFVWGPGQYTPIHNHTTWGLIGMLRGAEYSQGFERAAGGTLLKTGDAIKLEPGTVE